MPALAILLRVGVWISPPYVSVWAGPTSSMSTMRMFGASLGRWLTGGSGLYTDSCMVRPAMLPDGLGGNGKTSCAHAGEARTAPSTKVRAMLRVIPGMPNLLVFQLTE